MAAKDQPVIIVKKKGDHAGHHGGAWKVAYADFVTALMSLFIVLWLMGSSERVKQAVAGYFNDPRGTASLMGTTMTGTGETVTVADNNDLQRLKEKLEQEIKARKDLQKLSRQIEITITPEGLRIELMEDRNGTFFQSGSAQLSQNGQQLLALLAMELKTLSNKLLIEGHTDATQYSKDANYTNWELSADRANAARRLLQADGVRRDQVTQVRGYADQLLRVKSNPYDPSNRRISILVKNDEHGPARNLSISRVAVATPVAPSSGGSAVKPAAGTPLPARPSHASPPSRPGLAGKLTALLSGKKK